MSHVKKSDLFYTDYRWASPSGDGPKDAKLDASRFSRKEGYEVITLLNSLCEKMGPNFSARICEWMLHEKLPSNIQGRDKVIAWIEDNYAALSHEYTIQ